MSATDHFIYFNTMEELASWRPESALTHAWNISNTPLFTRPPTRSSNSDDSGKIPKLLLCHDFLGGYHRSESAQGLFNADEEAYTQEYLHLADAFVYFSHRRVSVPPAAWTNMCHRAGVACLGTFLVEPADVADAGRILEKGSEGEYLFAVQLARVAETYGFDGWLLNFECPIPREKWQGPGELQRFLEELRGQAGCRVVWYDALTVLNRVSYQNGLTLLNAPFLSAAGEMLANYWWRRPQLEASAAMADVMGKREGVLMGIDCYGRGSLGGGGYGIGVALEEIRQVGLQAALFAPGWTWENFGGVGFREVEEKFWGVVAETVAPKPAGHSGGFYTCFNRGFGSGFWVLGKKVVDSKWVHLGAQSLLPHFPSENWRLDPERAWLGAWSLKLSFEHPERQFVPLFRVGVDCVPNLLLRYTFQTTAAAGVYWDLLIPSGKKMRRTKSFGGPGSGWKQGSVLVDEEKGAMIVEVGVYAEAEGEAWLGELQIAQPLEEAQRLTISPVVVEGRRLKWSVYPSEGRGTWSALTKGCMYFLVWKRSTLRGMAYACEFILEQEEAGEWRVDGVTWGGELVVGPERPSI